jgi:hypothetical protein
VLSPSEDVARRPGERLGQRVVDRRRCALQKRFADLPRAVDQLLGGVVREPEVTVGGDHRLARQAVDVDPGLHEQQPRGEHARPPLELLAPPHERPERLALVVVHLRWRDHGPRRQRRYGSDRAIDSADQQAGGGGSGPRGVDVRAGAIRGDRIGRVDHA